jgi:hypothetical protein
MAAIRERHQASRCRAASSFDALPRPVSMAREGHSRDIVAILASSAGLASSCIHDWPTTVAAARRARDALNTNFTMMSLFPFPTFRSQAPPCPPSCLRRNSPRRRSPPLDMAFAGLGPHRHERASDPRVPAPLHRNGRQPSSPARVHSDSSFCAAQAACPPRPSMGLGRASSDGMDVASARRADRPGFDPFRKAFARHGRALPAIRPLGLGIAGRITPSLACPRLADFAARKSPRTGGDRLALRIPALRPVLGRP